MTDAIFHRVVHTSLSLLAFGMAGLSPVLTAALPSFVYARFLLQESTPLSDADFFQLWHSLERTDERSNPRPLGPFSWFEPFTSPPRTFLDDSFLPFRFDSSDTNRHIFSSLQRPSWTDAGPPSTPLFLFDWSRSSADPWTPRGLRQDGPKRIATAKAGTDWGILSSKVTLYEHDNVLDPSLSDTWETDESLRLSMVGPLFLFGQLGASSPSVEQGQLRWLGKTGIGVRLKPWLLQEVQVRGGPAVRYDGTGPPFAGQSQERSELFLEAVTKLPLPIIGPLNVEYTSYTVPSASPTDYRQVNQDFRLAMPLSSGGQFHVGARYHSENTPNPTPWVDRMQIYMGLQLKR